MTKNFRFHIISVASVCPSSCRCTTGQYVVDYNGNCNHWCSKQGFCGAQEDRKADGIDCRGCAGIKRKSVESNLYLGITQIFMVLIMSISLSIQLYRKQMRNEIYGSYY